MVIEKPTSIAEPLDLPEGLTARSKTIIHVFGFTEEDQLKLGTWFSGIALVFKLISPSRDNTCTTASMNTHKGITERVCNLRPGVTEHPACWSKFEVL